VQLSLKNLSAEDRRVYRNFVGGVFAVYAVALVIIAGMIVDRQVTQATARNEASSVSAESAQSVDVQSFRQAAKFD
jgi:hypothetical protein